ncbi:PREDICTED: uncharacterized protein LOC106818840 [Priapulus caudatus]|uniref:Uncharacterized protein LOC106818840 n=1 Tax=Priapulus caudatus TaxID=37621 RepID=A0ABM1F3H8_PRICU|nr:PREDICTED: uncharacterized protein LOC106818840 [Priapulus caudatus]
MHARNMVQIFYYENHGKCCRKILNYVGTPSKVLLYPDEGYVSSHQNAYWLLKTPWWNRNRCKIVEVCGNRRTKTRAKVYDNGHGMMYIRGRFRGKTDEPDFLLCLTSKVSDEDFQLGYTMTGTLERGDVASGKFNLTHYAMIKRKDS